MNPRIQSAAALSLFAVLASSAAQATPSLIAIGELSGSTAGSFADLSGLTGTLENGAAANLLGGLGSGLAWAGGNTFLALPDRGPNAVTYNPLVDNTTSYIARFQTLSLSLSSTPTTLASGTVLPYTLTPTLNATTLLSSSTALSYGTGSLGTGTSGTSTYTLGSGVPSINTPSTYYFTGRSDGFNAALPSTNPNNARLDPEGIRVSNDGRSVYVSDEYGPYVYQFDRTSGVRTNTYALPSYFGVSSLSAAGATEISSNTTGRVANKGMEGLAISPDGKTLVGFMQSPLAQDGGDGGQYNRIVTIDTATGATKQFIYDNKIGTKTYNSSEILAINGTDFLVLERDGKGLGDGSAAAVKSIYRVSITGATDISNLTNANGTPISGAANLAQFALSKTLFLDLKTAISSAVGGDANVPAKLEGMAFGEDIVVGGKTLHTLYVANDNDFVSASAGTNKFFVFTFSDADLGGSVLAQQTIAAVPEPEATSMFLAGLALTGAVVRRRRRRA
jgi:hypothetical protein